MVCVIFVAGHNDLLESEIASDVSGRFDKLKGVPKALLPAAASTDGTPSTILGRWWHLVNTRQILEVFLVTNANKFTRDGEIVVTCTTTVDSSGSVLNERPEYLLISVLDTGIGMSQSD